MLIQENQINFITTNEELSRIQCVKNRWKYSKTDNFSVQGGSKEQREKDFNNKMQILKKLYLDKEISEKSKMIEFAAGNGRLTKGFVQLPFVMHLDLVEPTQQLYKILKNLKNSKLSNDKIRHIYKLPGEKFIYEYKYDIIFEEEMINNMTDIEILKFLIKSKKYLKRDGKLIIVDLTSSGMNFVIPDVCVIYRSLDVYEMLFKLAGYNVFSKISEFDIFKHDTNDGGNYVFILEA